MSSAVVDRKVRHAEQHAAADRGRPCGFQQGDLQDLFGRPMRRREFVAIVVGAAVAWPSPLSAQQPPMPVVGFMSARSPGESASLVAFFHKGLNEVGYVEGRNV